MTVRSPSVAIAGTEPGDTMDDDTPAEPGGSPDERSALVAALMQRMADGDNAAAFELAERFGPELRATIGRIAVGRGARLGRQDLDDLVVDVALELNRLARSWRPAGGARPWSWARHRVAALVDRHIGQYATPLDAVAEPAAPDRPGTTDEEEPLLAVMERLAAADPTIALLVEALEQEVSARDRRLFLEIEVQQVLGDRAPAATVAALVGVSGSAARQQHRRTRLRLQRLAATDPRFAPLASLAIVA